MPRYPDPPVKVPNPAWRNRLTRLDLEVAGVLFGFNDVNQFAEFIAEQHERAIR